MQALANTTTAAEAALLIKPAGCHDLADIKLLEDCIIEVTRFMHFGASWSELLRYEKDSVRRSALTRFEDKKQMEQIEKQQRLSRQQ